MAALPGGKPERLSRAAYCPLNSRPRLHADRDWSGTWLVASCDLLPLAELEGDKPALLSAPTPLGVGQLRLASVMNPVEDPTASGKQRPTLLVSDHGLWWRVMGLTTKRHYADGSSRTSIPDPLAVGLHGPGYLWGDRLTRIRTSDIGIHIGFADRQLIDTLIQTAPNDLTAEEVRDLRACIETSGVEADGS